MDAVVQFFQMGGYALYVWGAYGVTFALLAIEVVLLLRRARRRIRPTAQKAPVRPQWHSGRERTHETT